MAIDFLKGGAGIVSDRSFNIDSEGINAAVVKALSEVVRRTFEQPAINAWAAQGIHLPTMVDLMPVTPEVITEEVRHRGRAGIITTDQRNWPQSSKQISEVKHTVALIGIVDTMSELQAKTYALAGSQPTVQFTDPVMEGEKAAVKGLIEENHYLGAYGASTYGMEGFLNHSGVTAVNSSFDPYDAGTTGATLLDFIVTEWYNVWNASKQIEVFKPNKLLVSANMLRQLKALVVSGTETTVYDQLFRAADNLQSIAPVDELDSANIGVNGGVADKERLVIYRQSNDMYNFFRKTSIVESRATQSDLQLKKYHYQSVSEVIMEYPSAARYVDYPKP